MEMVLVMELTYSRIIPANDLTVMVTDLAII